MLEDRYVHMSYIELDVTILLINRLIIILVATIFKLLELNSGIYSNLLITLACKYYVMIY